MMNFFYRVLILTVLLAGASPGITPVGLRALLESGEPVTLIDLRPQAAYEAGTIPNAMRMSLREAAEKPLRGRVVFFDDGTGPGLARRAAEQMNQMTGGRAEALRGGYAAWRDAQGQTTEPEGLRPSLVRYVSYQELTGAMTGDAEEIVLVDLRSISPQPVRAGLSGDGDTEEPVDLSAELPGFRIQQGLPAGSGSAGGPRPVRAGSDEPSPLYILIDSGDGQAEIAARKLTAAGVTRFAVLAGGEKIIRRRGEEGSIRRGPGAGLSPVERGAPFAAAVDEEVTP